MGIGKKIAKIRKKPEHIRERYVWFWVLFCMVFIFGIWFFSVSEVLKKSDFGKSSQDQDSDVSKNSLSSINSAIESSVQNSESKESIENLKK